MWWWAMPVISYKLILGTVITWRKKIFCKLKVQVIAYHTFFCGFWKKWEWVITITDGFLKHEKMPIKIEMLRIIFMGIVATFYSFYTKNWFKVSNLNLSHHDIYSPWL